MISFDQRRTARLLFQRLRPDDVDDLYRMYTNPQVMATLGGLRTEAQTRESLEKLLAHWEQYGYGWWIFREAQTGRFAGRGGLRHLVLEDKPEVEVTYGFLAEFWGRGLATEAARESVRIGFAELGLPDLVCFTLPTNLASRRVMEKAGFHYERDGIWANLPHVFFRLTASQWQVAAGAADAKTQLRE